jgi:hypothetical protein
VLFNHQDGFLNRALLVGADGEAQIPGFNRFFPAGNFELGSDIGDTLDAHQYVHEV